jgi:hypothetical protein
LYLSTQTINYEEMSKTFKSKYRPKNPEKYLVPSNIDNIVCRSSWERMICIWCDKNDEVEAWASEEAVVQYISPVDRKPHRYFIDFAIRFKNGKKLLIEVKPFYQTQKPENTKGKKQKTFINEVKTHAINNAKWTAAKKFAEDNGAEFVIWTENELEKLGLKPKMTKAFAYKKIGQFKKK